MPTRKEMDVVIERIEELHHRRFAVEEGIVRLSERDDAFHWSELTEERRLDVLNSMVEWNGFDREAQLDVIQNVMDGRQPWHYMDGVKLEGEVRPLTEHLIDCCRMDVWPSNATVVDFGIDSSSHLGALQFAIREELVTPQELEMAMGNGPALTEIAQRGGKNPYRFVEFKTAWDEPSKPAEKSYEPAEYVRPGPDKAKGGIER